MLANDVATLESFTRDADPTLTLRLDRTEKTVTLRLSEIAPLAKKDQERPLPVLQHAFARTIHKAQGQTADFTIVHAGGGLDASRAYVALTRHRQDAVVADAGAIAQRLAADGEKPTQEAVRMAFLRSAKASSDGLNASDYVADRATWLRTGDAKALPKTAEETRMQAIVRIAAEAARRVGAMVRWRTERIQAPEKPVQTPTRAPASAQTRTVPDEQQQTPSAVPEMPGIPATERLARVYAVRVSRGEMGFTQAVDALVSADQREAERTLEYHWNPVHQIATPKGGHRPGDFDTWVNRLDRRISLFEQGSMDALWPELAKLRQQAEARARRQAKVLSSGQGEAEHERSMPDQRQDAAPMTQDTAKQRPKRRQGQGMSM